MTSVSVARLPAGWAAVELPPMLLARQRFVVPDPVDVGAEVRRQWEAAWSSIGLAPGASVAVAVGSRGIDGLPTVVRAVVDGLKREGCRPFVVPAMGSHGGATAEGQAAVLAERGVTERSVGAPVRAGMEVVQLGEVGGLPLVMDRLAAAADGVILVNRVKPHTDFVGRFESGLMKMLVIGLGNEVGANGYHRYALDRGLADVVATAGPALLERSRVVLGVAIVENQRHEAAALRLVPAADWERVEPELLEQARGLLPRLPLDEIDVLVVDEMGKDISGAGMDPNVTGRSAGWSIARPSPRIGRIVMRSLTEATEGNASGMGLVDCASRRMVEQIDLDATVANALASCAPEDGKVPLCFASDREAVAAALGTLRPYTLDDLRLVHIRNTLALDLIELSPGCVSRITAPWTVEVADDAVPLAFDDDGTLQSRLV
ncbi:MAG TPA: lactate racemase domain-containing protein [Thermoleophilia bacterium]|nr:lactate racemase domain-containing protein [Thermoleophilia bacterium]